MRNHPLDLEKIWESGPGNSGVLAENEGKNEATVLDFFLQIGLTESMLSGAEKQWEIILLTWENSWKVTLEIRGFWPENEGKNEATILDFFSTGSMISGAEKNREIIPLTQLFYIIYKFDWIVTFFVLILDLVGR